MMTKAISPVLLCWPIRPRDLDLWNANKIDNWWETHQPVYGFASPYDLDLWPLTCKIYKSTLPSVVSSLLADCNTQTRPHNYSQLFWLTEVNNIGDIITFQKLSDSAAYCNSFPHLSLEEKQNSNARIPSIKSRI